MARIRKRLSVQFAQSVEAPKKLLGTTRLTRAAEEGAGFGLRVECAVRLAEKTRSAAHQRTKKRQEAALEQARSIPSVFLDLGTAEP